MTWLPASVLRSGLLTAEETSRARTSNPGYAIFYGRTSARSGQPSALGRSGRGSRPRGTQRRTCPESGSRTTASLGRALGVVDSLRRSARGIADAQSMTSTLPTCPAWRYGGSQTCAPRPEQPTSGRAYVIGDAAPAPVRHRQPDRGRSGVAGRLRREGFPRCPPVQPARRCAATHPSIPGTLLDNHLDRGGVLGVIAATPPPRTTRASGWVRAAGFVMRQRGRDLRRVVGRTAGGAAARQCWVCSGTLCGVRGVAECRLQSEDRAGQAVVCGL